MTMVFGGIDLPIFEMLFIVSALLLAGLFVMILGIFYILKELRSLKEIMKKEENNIKAFEKSIDKLKGFNSGDKSTDELKKYVTDNLAKGFKWEHLKAHLTKQGWDEKQLEEVYKS